MTVGIAGLHYEKLVYETMLSAGIKDLHPGDSPGAGFSNQGAGDINAVYKGESFDIEAKATSRDQMGGTSLRYDHATQEFTPVKTDIFDASELEYIISNASEKVEYIDNYILEAQKLEPVSRHKEISGVPLTISYSGRDVLKKKGLLRMINKNIKSDIGFVIRHYNKKGVYYIQIGGLGLFYMGKNPLNLPVPELQGETVIEFRLSYAGGKSHWTVDDVKIPVRSAGLRLQARINAGDIKSPYSLDNEEDVRNLFKEVA